MYEAPETTLDRTMHLIGELMAAGYDANLEHVGGTEYVAIVAGQGDELWVITAEATLHHYERASDFLTDGYEAVWETYLPTGDQWEDGVPAAEIVAWVLRTWGNEDVPTPEAPTRTVAPVITTATPVIVDVEIKPLDDDPEYADDFTGCFSVHTVWGTAEGLTLDRPDVGGWVFNKRQLCDRLAAAIRDGAVYTDAEVRIDVSGRSYVGATGRVLGRHANADLKRLGY